MQGNLQISTSNSPTNFQPTGAVSIAQSNNRNVSNSRNKAQQSFNTDPERAGGYQKQSQKINTEKIRLNNSSAVSANVNTNATSNRNQKVTNITNIIYNFNLTPSTTTAVTATQSLVPVHPDGIDSNVPKIGSGSQRSQSSMIVAKHETQDRSKNERSDINTNQNDESEDEAQSTAQKKRPNTGSLSNNFRPNLKQNQVINGQNPGSAALLNKNKMQGENQNLNRNLQSENQIGNMVMINRNSTIDQKQGNLN